MAASVEFDDENPEWTEEDFEQARPAVEVLPAEVLAAFGRRRGRPPLEVTKVPVKLRLDPDVLDAFKREGPGWQTRMAAVLRKAVNL